MEFKFNIGDRVIYDGDRSYTYWYGRIIDQYIVVNKLYPQLSINRYFVEFVDNKHRFRRNGHYFDKLWVVERELRVDLVANRDEKINTILNV